MNFIKQSSWDTLTFKYAKVSQEKQNQLLELRFLFIFTFYMTIQQGNNLFQLEYSLGL